ncbi:tyrosine-type recombinase/integrase [Cycloclasticus zancles]|uniref:Site-specific recombinase, phage integrase family n=1 Tax=Cycloclasticus zancles 78-ME TaxID=1198232 RepID=S5T7N3_9GAMM|nr:site-specific integrase [Cycloclasticus zancles]AGS39604.1 Site-specific recombinase, phage integrase family [Cycloclasticus zancles 78-ME]
MAIHKPVALYPTFKELKDIPLDEFPELSSFLASGPDWRKQSWLWGQEFLSYIGRNKSQHTYTRFRSEIEKFLLWSFVIKESPCDEFRKTDILDYADFCWKPPQTWISLTNHDKFQPKGDGTYIQNKAWSPYRLVVSKGDNSTPDKKKYRPSQQTLRATFTAIIAFYKYLMDEEYCVGNPAQLAKKDCRHFIKDAQVKDVKRLSEEQWLFLLETVTAMADDNSRFERNLFLIAALKTLFLRISEFSERPDWIPVMGHFWEDTDKNWWLKVYGKGRKLRDITVPSSFMPYLKRYRLYRGMSSLPLDGEKHPIVEKLRGSGGMTARQLSRLVQEVFDHAYETMKKQQGEEIARKFREVSTHWLRHTGASLEIERGRALKDLSEDLGHSSMATTDTVYVQSEDRKRAESGKNREV